MPLRSVIINLDLCESDCDVRNVVQATSLYQDNFIYFHLSGTAFFTFKLEAFYNSDFTGEVPNPVELGKILYFKATVETKSAAPNLDLFPVHCWSSMTAEPDSEGRNITLIKNGQVHIFISFVSQSRTQTTIKNSLS